MQYGIGLLIQVFELEEQLQQRIEGDSLTS